LTAAEPSGRVAATIEVGPRAANAGPVADGIALTRPPAAGKVSSRAVPRQRRL